jgi:UDP-glucose:(heptosyl)LPS alpha-1,3-glucosyltransferase
MKPKIALLLPKLSLYGGAERFAYNLATFLAPDFDVHFIYAKKETAEPKGVKVTCLGRPPLGKAMKVLWYAVRAELFLRKQHFDLSVGLGNTFRQDVLRLSGGPIKIFWELSKKAYPKGFSRNFKMFRRRISPGNRLTQAIERIQLRNSQHLIAVSHLVRDWTIKAYPFLSKKKFQIIYNQPDLSRFSPAGRELKQKLRDQFGLPRDKIIVSTAGTNFMLKGVAQLISSLRFLPETFYLIVAGKRNPAYFLRLARKLNVADRVHFMGQVKDMVSFYRASDIFALPTFYDACSNAVLEAMACGIPVVSSQNNGSSIFLPKELVIQNPTNHKDLAEKILLASQHKTPGFTWPENSKSVRAGLTEYKKTFLSLLG